MLRNFSISRVPCFGHGDTCDRLRRIRFRGSMQAPGAYGFDDYGPVVCVAQNCLGGCAALNWLAEFLTATKHRSPKIRSIVYEISGPAWGRLADLIFFSFSFGALLGI